MFYGLRRHLAAPVFPLFGGLAILMTVQALTGTEQLASASEVVAGFGNSGRVTVGLLLGIVAELAHKALTPCHSSSRL